jgi:hypothetical protein
LRHLGIALGQDWDMMGYDGWIFLFTLGFWAFWWNYYDSLYIRSAFYFDSALHGSSRIMRTSSLGDYPPILRSQYLFSLNDGKALGFAWLDSAWLSLSPLPWS